MKDRLPITILTGFLGSGKTTVLNKLVQNESFQDTAILINEFGEVGLDHLLVSPLEDEEIVLLNAGCLCCTIRTDLIATLNNLWEKRSIGEIPQFKRVLIETTGLADPAPILHTLLTEEGISENFCIDGIVTTVDALNAQGLLTKFSESVKQVAVADRLLVTKGDLVSRKCVDDLLRRLKLVNQHATILRTSHGDVDPHKLLGIGTSAHDVFLSKNRKKRSHEHNHGIHDDRVKTFYLKADIPIALHRFVAWIEKLIAKEGEKLLRLKGLLCVEGVAQPVVVHGVQHVFHPLSYLTVWPDDSRVSRIVVIGYALCEDTIRGTFEREVLDEIN